MSGNHNTGCNDLPAAPVTGPVASMNDEPSGYCSCCNGWGYLYEGGMSMNPEIDNKTPCPHCNPDPESP
jgi:hypothetical protein